MAQIVGTNTSWLENSRLPLRPGLVIAGILLVAANLRAGITVVGPLLGEVRADLSLSAVAASALISVPVLAFAAFSPLVPPIAVRFGMERTVGAALVLLILGIVCRSVPLTGALWVGTIALGIAIAVINVLLPAVLKRDFPRDVGRFTGVYSAVQSFFAAVAAGLAVPLAGGADAGWRVAFGIWAGLALIALGVFAPQLRGRSRGPSRPGPNRPGPNLAPALDGDSPTQDTDGKARSRSPWASAIGWQATVFMGTQSTIYYVALTWLPAIEHAHGIDAPAAGWHQSALQLAGIAGSLTSAVLLHRWRRDQRGLVSILAPIAGIGILGILVLPDLILLWDIMIGFAAGGLIVLALALFGLRTGNHRQAAALSGMGQSFGYLIAAAGPIALGAIHDATGSWTLPLIVLLGVVVAVFVSGYLAGRDRVLH